MKLLSAGIVLLACFVSPSAAGTRTARIIGDPMRRGPEEPDTRPPLTPEETEEAKKKMFQHILDGDIPPKELMEVSKGLKRTLNEEEKEDYHYSIHFLKNALARTPEVPPEEDDPDFPPAAERYAARAKNKAYRRGEMGPVDIEVRKEFEETSKFTPAEKESAIKVRDEKVKLWHETKDALKKHESGEEKLSDEDFEKYTKQMEELKAEKKIEPLKKSAGFPQFKNMPGQPKAEEDKPSAPTADESEKKTKEEL